MKTRILLATLVAAGAALASTAASAQTDAQAYVGGGVGQSRADVDCTGSTVCDKTDTAFKIFGGYMFTKNFGLEGAYYNQGKARLEGTDPELGTMVAEYKGRGFGIFALGAMPLGDGFSVFAKLGAVSAKITVDATSSSVGSGSQSERHTNFGWGVGAAYEIVKQLDVRLEWERIRVQVLDEKRNADLLTLGLQYRF